MSGGAGTCSSSCGAFRPGGSFSRRTARTSCRGTCTPSRPRGGTSRCIFRTLPPRWPAHAARPSDPWRNRARKPRGGSSVYIEWILGRIRNVLNYQKEIPVNLEQLRTAIGATWRDSNIGRLTDYVRIPNKSPVFDPAWEANGHMNAAVQLMADWCSAQPVPGMRVEVRRLPGRTPILLVDVPGELPGSVLLYGHLDKQPEFTGWLPGLGPWEPVLRDGKLYGRGAADDGYAVFSSLTAISALKAQRVALPRCVLLIEATEESGSIDLPAHLEALGDALGNPSLVVCLDAECGNYEQVWCTTSLRGNLVGLLHVRVLEEGVHSGMATGIAATPFRIVEQLLARLESPINGGLLLD